MIEKTPPSKKGLSADWLLRGSLTKIGDLFDRFTGRRWIPSSSLATSELIERIKTLLDSEARSVAGKGTVVPHHIRLKMQWDKFSTDSEKSMKKLENELLIAAIDHINDCLYYTYAPVTMEIKPDYFTEGVKLFVGFERFDDEERGGEVNVTVPVLNISGLAPEAEKNIIAPDISFLAHFRLKDSAHEVRVNFPATGRVSVGRTGENGLSIDDASISKIHATISINPDGNWSVADTGSTNGTFINGERIEYGKAIALDPKDIVKFGSVDVTFEMVTAVVPIPADLVESTGQNPTVLIDGFTFESRTSSEDPKDPSGEDGIEISKLS